MATATKTTPLFSGEQLPALGQLVERLLQDDHYRTMLKRRDELRDGLARLEERESELRNTLRSSTARENRTAKIDALIDGQGAGVDVKTTQGELSQVLRDIPLHRQAIEKLNGEVKIARGEAAAGIAAEVGEFMRALTRRRLEMEIALARANALESALGLLLGQAEIRGAVLTSSSMTPGVGAWQNHNCRPRLRLAEFERLGLMTAADVKTAIKAGEAAPLLD